MSLENSTVLVVEDDTDIRDNLKEFLEGEGFDVCTAKDGMQALDMLEQMEKLPSLCLLDLMMPVVDGKAFIKMAETRFEKQLKSMPIIIFTAASADEVEKEGRVIIKKPFDLDFLLKTVREHCH